MIVRCALFTLFAVILTSCSFTPDNHYINPNIYPPADFIATEIDVDDVEGTYPLAFPTFFRVSVDRVGKQLLYFKVTKNGQEVATSNSDNLTFIVDPTDLEDGTHQFDIEVKLSSGSGSLAEHAGYEYYLVQKQLVVTVDRKAPQPVSNLSANMVNGHMTLTWDKPSSGNYGYTVTKYNEKREYMSAVDFRDMNMTSYVDEEYLGGKVSYIVILQSIFFNVSSDYVDFNLDPVEATAAADANDHLTWKWTMKYPFGDDVFIKVVGRNRTLEFPAANGEAVVDTIYLGDVATTSFRIFRRGFESGGLTFSKSVSIGTRVKAFHYYKFLEASDKLILHHADNPLNIYRYNANTMEVEDSLRNFQWFGYNLLSSENGQLNFMYQSGYMYSFNPLDFSQASSPIYLNDIYRAKYFQDLIYAVYYSVTNTNFLVLTNQLQNAPQIVTIDLNTKQIWGSLIPGAQAVVSGDGNLMIVNNFENPDAVVYKKGVSDWQEIGKVSGINRFSFGGMFFSSGLNPKLICSYDDVTNVYDVTTPVNGSGYFVSLRSAPIRTTAFDLIHDHLIQEIVDDKLISHISTYALNDLSLVSKITARGGLGTEYYSHSIVGDYHLTSNGFIKAIN